MVFDWLAHTVKHEQIFKDANVKATYLFLGLTSIIYILLQSVLSCSFVSYCFAPLPYLYEY